MPAVDLDYARQLIATELPARVRWLIHGTPLDFSFERSRSPLQPLSPEEIHGALQPRWSTLHIFGEQDYAEGGGATPALGVDSITGEVLGLDVERESQCLYLLNSDAGAFVSTFHLFDAAVRLGTVSLDTVAHRALQIDPSAFERSDWAQLLQYLREDGP